MKQTFTDANFESILAGNLPVVIDFSATWCGPCRMVGPIMDELAVAGAHGVSVVADSLFADNDYSDANLIFLPGATFPLSFSSKTEKLLTSKLVQQQNPFSQKKSRNCSDSKVSEESKFSE